MYSRILVKHALELSLLCSSRLEHFSVHFKFLAEFECIYAYSNCTTLTLSNLHSTGLRIKDISKRENREENLSSRSIDIATDLFRSKRVRKRLDWSNIDPVLQKALPSIILIGPCTCSFDSVSASKATNYISNTMRVTWYSERKCVKRCSGEISTVHSSFAYGPRYHAIQRWSRIASAGIHIVNYVNRVIRVITGIRNRRTLTISLRWNVLIRARYITVAYANRSIDFRSA